MEKGEGTFFVDEDAPPPLREDEDEEDPKKAFFRNCSLKNILVEAITDDDGKVLLSDYTTLENRMVSITDDNLLKKKIDRTGKNGTRPPLNAKVWIHYTAMCEEYDEPIDTAYATRLYAFKLGNADILPAFDHGVQTMELKEIAKFLAYPEYAYGPLGIPGRVPANARILFTIELVDFMEATATKAIFEGNAQQRALLDFEDIYKSGNEIKGIGNQHCSRHEWDSAITQYRKAVRLLDRYLTVDEDVDKKRNDLLFILYINLAQCYLHNKDYEKVVSMCRRALELPPKTEGNRCKAYYRQAKAQYELGQFELSKKSCISALDIEPGSREAKTLNELVNRRLTQDGKEERKLFKRMLSGMTTS